MQWTAHGSGGTSSGCQDLASLSLATPTRWNGNAANGLPLKSQSACTTLSTAQFADSATGITNQIVGGMNDDPTN
jgi:hypothetical protein